MTVDDFNSSLPCKCAKCFIALSIMSKAAFVLFLCCFVLLAGCSPTIALFDQYAYTQTTSIKVDALNLMDSATEEYSSHRQEVAKVNVEIQKIIEYEKHRPNDSITTRMWLLLNDSTGHLYGGFIKRWKTKGHLSPTAIADVKPLIGDDFDRIAELESKKIKPSQVTTQ